MRSRLVVLVAVLALLSVTAGAADHVIHQAGRTFSEQTITVARNATVVFMNDDTVPHNVMSVTPNNAFNLGSQLPGTAIPVRFDVAGVVVVICAIHPRMHMTISVTE